MGVGLGRTGDVRDRTAVTCQSVAALAFALALVALIVFATPALAAVFQGRARSSAVRGAAFLSPRSLGVECFITEEPGVFVGVNCQSVKAAPLYEQKATLDANGHDVFCHEHLGDNHCNLGNRGENPIKTVGFGRHITVGRFRCQVQHTGVKCIVRASRKGFLMSNRRLVAVGGAKASQAPLQLTSFISPDRKVLCAMTETRTSCGAGTGLPESRAELLPGGEVTICFITQRKEPPLGVGPPESCLQQWDPHGVPVLKYGQQSEWNGAVCTSAPNGITCVEVAGAAKGKGFRVSATEAVEVG